MRMIERRQFALAHELPRPDLDDRDARCVVEVRNDSLSHVVASAFARPAARRRRALTRAAPAGAAP